MAVLCVGGIVKRILRLGIFVLIAVSSLLAQTETGKFRLHKFEQPIGEESYKITKTADGLELSADFLFTDRGSPVPLKASIKSSTDYTPANFEIKGKTSRESIIDTIVTVSNGKAVVRENKNNTDESAPDKFFTIAGYAPVSVQMALIRYWKGHGSPAKLAVLPTGILEIKDRGADTFSVGGRPVQLERYSVRGLVWGLQTLWMDKQDNLAALVTRDAEFDHFEAIREGYEDAVTNFVTSAAQDEMAELLQMSRQLPGRKSGTMAFTGATLIDGTANAPIVNATVVSKDGKIIAAGPADKVDIPADATRIDISGKYIIPGLWDMHAHYEQVEWGPIYLAAGVTTVRDVGNELEFIKEVRDKVNTGQGLGPHMLLAGIVDGDGPIALGVERVNTQKDAVKWVKAYHDAGFQQMKLYSSLKPEMVKAVCAEAHKLGMTVTGHIPQGMDIYDGVNSGMDQVNHLQYVMQALWPKGTNPRKLSPDERKKLIASATIDSPEGQKLVKFLKDHGTVIDDTAALFELILHPASDPITDVEPGVAKLAPELRAQFNGMGSTPDRAEETTAMMRQYVGILRALHKAGVTVVAGTDQAVPGYTVYREMELYVQAGFTPLEALQAATIVPARVMKENKQSGTVEIGKRADFDILDANPLEKISNVRSVHQVVANGILYDSAPLWVSVGFKP
jgi:imidazolonepropionase-like amidohydrolase